MAIRAEDVMTTGVVTVSPDTPVSEIARLLLDHRISAVPVVDATGAPVGMVSEGDLIGRDETDREARRDWWLSLIAEGEELHPDFLASLRRPAKTARDVMAAPVITVPATAEIREIARVLTNYRIKRVPVLRDAKLVGIVSRADLLQAFSAEGQQAAPPHRVSHARNLLAEALAALDEHFLSDRQQQEQAGTRTAPGAQIENGLSVADFRGLVADYEHQKATRQSSANRARAEQRREQVKHLIDRHLKEEEWNALAHRAREAAEHGEKEMLLLRFPSELCTDGGRAINAALSTWPTTLRGEAAEIYLKWERDLKPRGFHLAARVLDFPQGMPGDVGLFLIWGE